MFSYRPAFLTPPPLHQIRARAAAADDLEKQLAERAQANQRIWEDLRKEQVTRKKLHNKVQDLKGAVRVFARCRPMSSSEEARGCEQCVEFLTPQVRVEVYASVSVCPSPK